jgi:hypothetical protein
VAGSSGACPSSCNRTRFQSVASKCRFSRPSAPTRYGPEQAAGHIEAAAFRDPAGNVFGVYHHTAP